MGTQSTWDVPDTGLGLTATQRVLAKNGVWSVGSKRHEEGLCKPCHFVHTKKGCKSGQGCAFCHLPHTICTSKTENRPSKSDRDQCKKLLGIVDREGLEGEQLKQIVRDVSCQSTYVKSIVHKHVKAVRGSGRRQGESDSVQQSHSEFQD